ncbi:MAG: hypothetical protein JNL22_14895 [Bacteroidales bacterium]|jgi:hypothetical protein|nr:hypothetical protein [Bacteroidales bacterium]
MIHFEEEFLAWITSKGVGKKDVVASSTVSYISYLNSVSTLLQEDISPTNVFDQKCIDRIMAKIGGKRSLSSEAHYRTVLNHYVKMVQQGYHRKQLNQ